MDSPKKTDEHKKMAFKGAATYRSMYKRDWKILIQLQRLVATSMLFTVFHLNEILHVITWILEM